MNDDKKSSAMNAYLAGLPDGLDSYPECLSKASLYRAIVADRPLPAAELAALPTPLRRLVDQPVPVSSWISEVHSHALILSIYDAHFGELESFKAWAYAQQRALFTGPLYSVAMRLVSPSLLFKTATVRFGMFHRGTRLTVVERRSNGGTTRLECPPGLYDLVSLTGLCMGLRAALDLTGAQNVSVEIGESGAGYTVLNAEWSG